MRSSRSTAQPSHGTGVSKCANGARRVQVHHVAADKTTVERIAAAPLVSTSVAVGSSAPSGRGLDADLAKREVQLSDWVHCVSASTPRGKAKIEEISAQISDIRTKMKQAEQATPPAPVAAPSGRLLDVYA